MKLTQEHIDQLYRFTRAHYVEWYDLQTELVDHLANDIEDIMEKEPTLNFDQAKNKAFKKFGIFGFHDVITDKSKSVNKRYWKLFGQIFKDYFKLPKITLTLMTTLLVFSILRLTGHEVLFLITIFWIIFIYPVVFGFRYKSKLKRRFKKTGKKWMVDEVIKQSGLLFLISIQTPIQLLRYADTDKIFILNSTELLVASFMLTVFAIFVYILTTLVPPKLEKEMCKLYPEYKVYLKA